MFISGMTRIWCKPQRGENQHWFKMSYAPRGFKDNERLVDHYESEFPGMYFYQITADSELCRPIG